MKRWMMFALAILLVVEGVSAITFSSPYGTVSRCKDYEPCVPFRREFRITAYSSEGIRSTKVRDLAEGYTPRSAAPKKTTGPMVIRGNFSARFPSRRELILD